MFINPEQILSQSFLRKTPETKLTRTTYNRWTDAIRLSNGRVEAIVVPTVGRVMQFRQVGEIDGPFWENRQLDGTSPDPEAREWMNFGGDKTWPSPQANWPQIAGRGWPPPKAFDSMSCTATLDETRGRVILTSPIDPAYGIRTVRTISMVEGEYKMSIHTRYEKVEGSPVKTGIWIITQLRDPELVVMPLTKRSKYPDGYNRQSDKLPEGLHAKGNLLLMTRARGFSSKIGNDASALLWVGRRDMVLIESQRRGRGEYPDQGSSAEIYTNPDPLTYVELELLGPMKTLKIGQRLDFDTTYTLLPRKRADPIADAEAVFDKP